MGWLTNSVPNLARAEYIGSLEGENRALEKALDKWINYAENLEKKVKFYRAEAVNGWAYWKAAEKIAKDKFNHDLRSDPDLQNIKKSFMKEMAEAVDRDVKADMNRSKQ